MYISITRSTENPEEYITQIETGDDETQVENLTLEIAFDPDTKKPYLDYMCLNPEEISENERLEIPF